MASRFSFFFRNGPVAILIAAALGACSKPQSPSGSSVLAGNIPQVFPVSAAMLKNCRFKDPDPVYTAGVSITPNSILCDEGAVSSVSLLNPAPLPTGLSFSMAQLSLTGTPSQKTAKTLYQFYVENSAGYVVLKMQLTVK